MKNIFCYGDSITYGFDPVTWGRYEYDDRWTSALQKQLGSGYYVTVDALDGRTTCWDLPYLPYRNGSESLPMLLETNSPLDLIIIMLGANDMIKMLDKTAGDAVMGLMSLVIKINQSSCGRNGSPPKIIIICPPVFGKISEFMSISYSGKDDECNKLADLYRIFCNTFGCTFLDSNEFIKTSDPDGVHISKESQRILGMKVAEVTKKILG